MNTYHNTTNQSGSTLKEYTEKAKSQDEIILELYKKHKRLSPSRVFVLMQQIAPAPLTSCRRGVSNLTGAGMLRKLDDKVNGIYKRPEHIWEYVDPNDGYAFSIGEMTVIVGPGVVENERRIMEGQGKLF